MTVEDPTAGAGPVGAVPNLQARTVVGVFDTVEQAEAAASALKETSLSAADVSFLRRPPDGAAQVGAGETNAGKGTVAGMGTGALIGGGLATLAALAVPGIGPLLAAGPIAAMLAGAATGGALGALAGSFAGLGVPSEHAERYERAVREGGIFMSAKTPDEQTADAVERVLTQHGAREVSSYQPAL